MACADIRTVMCTQANGLQAKGVAVVIWCMPMARAMKANGQLTSAMAVEYLSTHPAQRSCAMKAIGEAIAFVDKERVCNDQ